MRGKGWEETWWPYSEQALPMYSLIKLPKPIPKDWQRWCPGHLHFDQCYQIGVQVPTDGLNRGLIKLRNNRCSPRRQFCKQVLSVHCDICVGYFSDHNKGQPSQVLSHVTQISLQVESWNYFLFSWRKSLPQCSTEGSSYALPTSVISVLTWITVTWRGKHPCFLSVIGKPGIWFLCTADLWEKCRVGVEEANIFPHFSHLSNFHHRGS